jgi:hypothetical protein
MTAEEVLMTHGSGPTVVTAVEAAADTALSALEGASSVDPAAAFLAGELLSRAEARAGAGGLVPSDLGAYEGRPTAKSFFFICITPGCFPKTVPFFRCGPPEQPVSPEPDRPGEPDAPDR